MKLYRFSPIKNKEELLVAIEYLHKASHELCFKILNKHLPIAENFAVFCHYEEEFKLLEEVRDEITTDAAD